MSGGSTSSSSTSSAPSSTSPCPPKASTRAPSRAASASSTAPRSRASRRSTSPTWSSPPTPRPRDPPLGRRTQRPGLLERERQRKRPRGAQDRPPHRERPRRRHPRALLKGLAPRRAARRPVREGPGLRHDVLGPRNRVLRLRRGQDAAHRGRSAQPVGGLRLRDRFRRGALVERPPPRKEHTDPLQGRVLPRASPGHPPRLPHGGLQHPPGRLRRSEE